MATHSSILAWKIPWMEEPGRLQSMGLQKVRHDWATSFFFSFLCGGPWRKKPLDGDSLNLELGYSFLGMGLPWWLSSEESACNAGDLGSIPGLGRSSGEGNSYPLQYSGLENSMDFHGVTKSHTQLCNFHILKIVYILKGWIAWHA